MWAVLSIDTIFETYDIQSASENDTINLEVPIALLHRALRSALSATSAQLRLTKKNGIPILCLTVVTNTFSRGGGLGTTDTAEFAGVEEDFDVGFSNVGKERETVITHDVPIRVLAEDMVEGIHEPVCREPDVHILLPGLMQLKSISERFTKLALATKSTSTSTAIGPKLELSANMHGSLKLAIKTDALNISSVWSGLTNPDLDPTQVDGPLENHPSVRMKALGGENGENEAGWAKVLIDGKDWGKVLSVGRLGGKVIACMCLLGRYIGETMLNDLLPGFCHDRALILYVYLTNDDGAEDSVLTVMKCSPRMSENLNLTGHSIMSLRIAHDRCL